MVEDLYIKYRDWRPISEIGVIENILRLELLLPFIAVKNLYLSREFAQGIAAALREAVGDRIAEVLPSLQNTFCGGAPGGAQAIRTSPGKHWAVCCRTTALRSPYHHFRLG